MLKLRLNSYENLKSNRFWVLSHGMSRRGQKNKQMTRHAQKTKKHKNAVRQRGGAQRGLKKERHPDPQIWTSGEG